MAPVTRTDTSKPDSSGSSSGSTPRATATSGFSGTATKTSFQKNAIKTSFDPVDAESESLKDRQVVALTRPREKESKEVKEEDKPKFPCKKKLNDHKFFKLSGTAPIRYALTGPLTALEYIGWAGKWVGKNSWADDSKKVKKPNWHTDIKVLKPIVSAANSVARKALDVKQNLEIPAPIYNHMPFRARDFVETTPEEDENFSERLDKTLDHYLQEYNKDKKHDYEIIDKKDVVAKYVHHYPKKDGTLNYKRSFSFRVVYRKKGQNGYILDKNGNYTYDLKYLFQGKIDEVVDYDHPILEALGVFKNFQYLPDESGSNKTLRDTYKTGVEYLNTKKLNTPNAIEPKKPDEKTSNNCWLESSLQAILHDDDLLQKVDQFNVALNKEIEKNYDDYKKAHKDASITLEEFKASAELNGKYGAMILVQCLLESRGKPLNGQNAVIKKYAADIRKHCLPKATMHSQEDTTDLLFFLITELSKVKIIPTYEMSTKKHLKEIDDKKDSSKLEKYPYDYKDTITRYILFHLADYPDAVSEKPILDIGKVIDGTATKEEVLEYDKGTGKKTWRVEKEENQYKFDNEPEDGIAFYFSRSKATTVKHETKLINIPDGLDFNDHRFNPQSSSVGKYQIKYALIHNGSLNSGHYYTLCREDSTWYTYNGSIKEEVKDEKTRKEILENAVYIHYEKTSS